MLGVDEAGRGPVLGAVRLRSDASRGLMKECRSAGVWDRVLPCGVFG